MTVAARVSGGDRTHSLSVCCERAVRGTRSPVGAVVQGVPHRTEELGTGPETPEIPALDAWMPRRRHRRRGDASELKARTKTHRDAAAVFPQRHPRGALTAT